MQLLAKDVLAQGDPAWPRLWLALQPAVEELAAGPPLTPGPMDTAQVATAGDVVVLVWEKLQQNDFNKLRAFFRYRTVIRQSHAPGDGAPSPFATWLRRVVEDVRIDVARCHRAATSETELGPRPLTAARGGARAFFTAEGLVAVYWKAVATLDPSARGASDVADGRPAEMAIGSDPDLDIEMSIGRMLEFLDAIVPVRLRRAVALAASDAPLDHIARELGVSGAAIAERVIARGRVRLRFRDAVELWSQGVHDAEIAEELGLAGVTEARCIIHEAQELLRRHFHLDSGTRSPLSRSP